MTLTIPCVTLQERRGAKRFEIDCPVTVRVQSRRKGCLPEEGRLCDIGLSGARILLTRPLPLGTRVVLDAYFTNTQDAAAVRFEGVVARVQRRFGFEIVVQFRRSGQFVRVREFQPMYASALVN